MDPILIGILGILAMLVLLALGVHVGVGMLLVGLVGFAAIGGWSGGLGLLAFIPYDATASFTFTVLPLFILMGNFFVHAGMGEELYTAASKWLGRLPGGLAMATTAACAAFGACSGASIATAATFTKICLPEMKKRNYDEGLASGAIAASGTLATMIPPSGVMVLFGILTQTSIGKLLIAGIIPGLLIALLYCIAIYTRVRMNPRLAPPIPGRVSWKERFSVLKGLLPVGVIFVIAIGGIYLGVFTPTEGAAVGAFGAGLICLVRRKMNLHRLRESLTDTVKTTAFIFFIIVGALVFGRFLAITGIVTAFGDLLRSSAAPPVVIVLLIMGVYLILGMVMDVVAMLALTLPVFFPVVASLGVNPIWFGILVVVMVETAFVTPPIGLNCYAVSATGGVKLETVFRGILIFIIADVVAIGLIVAFPQIAVWLPSTMGR